MVAAFGAAGVARANDWGMGDANAKLAHPNIFAPVSTPADEVHGLAMFVLAVTGTIFVVVGGLLAYGVVRFRARPGDEGREPAQVYGSNPVELAWTMVPLLIVSMILGYSGNQTAMNLGNTVLFTTIMVIIFDIVMLRFRLRREMARRFPGEPTKGVTMYAAMRSLQMKFLRLPKAQVKIGQKLPETYR